jgi:hypothetical protein
LLPTKRQFLDHVPDLPKADLWQFALELRHHQNVCFSARPRSNAFRTHFIAACS